MQRKYFYVYEHLHVPSFGKILVMLSMNFLPINIRFLMVWWSGGHEGGFLGLQVVGDPVHVGRDPGVDGRHSDATVLGSKADDANLVESGVLFDHHWTSWVASTGVLIWNDSGDFLALTRARFDETFSVSIYSTLKFKNS